MTKDLTATHRLAELVFRVPDTDPAEYGRAESGDVDVASDVDRAPSRRSTEHRQHERIEHQSWVDAGTGDADTAVAGHLVEPFGKCWIDDERERRLLCRDEHVGSGQDRGLDVGRHIMQPAWWWR